MFQWFIPQPNIKLVNFEYVKKYEMNQHILIHTLAEKDETCLIKGTIYANREEMTINDYLNDYNTTIGIIVYGRNSTDESAMKKCQQLAKLGFVNIYCYVGGLFEWLLLQELYGKDEFPTNGKCTDLLVWR